MTGSRAKASKHLPSRKIRSLIDHFDRTVAEERTILLHGRQHRLLQSIHQIWCQAQAAS